MVRTLNEVLWNDNVNGTSVVLGVDVYPLRTWQVIIDAAGTVSLQASEDASTWYEVDSHTATGVTSDNNARLYVRAVVSGATGNVKIILSGNG